VRWDLGAGALRERPGAAGLWLPNFAHGSVESGRSWLAWVSRPMTTARALVGSSRSLRWPNPRTTRARVLGHRWTLLRLRGCRRVLPGSAHLAQRTGRSCLRPHARRRSARSGGRR
jgi:hypothetical protein